MLNFMQSLYTEIVKAIGNTPMWVNLGITTLKIIFILVLAYLLVRISQTTLNNIFKQREKAVLSQRRSNTVRSLMNNVATYVIYTLASLTVLEQMGVEMGPILAGAGVLGLAIGFGAQNLVRDIITGFFIIFEDQFAVGDYISTGNFTGTVVEMGLRITKIRNVTGEIHILPNGSITEVTNFSIANSVSVVDIHVAYEENQEEVQHIITQILESIPHQFEECIKTPELLGIQSLGPHEVVYRIHAECKPMMHHALSRKIRAQIKQVFDEKGIEIPYPRTVMIQK